MALRYSFDAGGAFRKKVRGWRQDLKDLRWAWPSVASAVEIHHARVFDSEGAINDGGWINLSRVTIKARFFGWHVPGSVTGAYEAQSSESDDHRILHWTHRLRRSLTGPGGDSIRDYRRGSMVFGTRAPHADVLHNGGKSNVGPGLPPRPIIDPHGTVGVVETRMQRMMDSYFRAALPNA